MLEIKIGKNGALLSEEEGEESTPLLLVRFTAAREQQEAEKEADAAVPYMNDEDTVGAPVLAASPILDSGAVVKELITVAGLVLVEKKKALNTAEQANQTMKSMQQFFGKMIAGQGGPGTLPPWLRGE